ncbi:GPALPP motifs-containing protein 1 [Octopus sinensis]|uniref:GPALPP motifs-containing protein 1 n=1 Tax=Octopus sinensis TaxID=2607531 RepID=A0A6P7S670_9MOLL|nr:GPALPP motifs-containing protein 1 [Octopus sinensis]
MSGQYGPVLPPGFKRSHVNDNILTSSEGNVSSEDNLPTCSNNTSNSGESDFIDSEKMAHLPKKDTKVSSSWQQISSGDYRSACQKTPVSSLSQKEDNIVVGPIVRSSQKSKLSTYNVEESSSTPLKEHKIIGPQLSNMNTIETKASTCSSPDTFNNEPFPDANQSRCASSYDVFGPALPPDLIKDKAKDNCSVSEKPSTLIEDFSLIGPLPSEMFQQGMKDESISDDIEKRSLDMKDKLTKKVDGEVLSRETWMLELPPEIGPGLGLVARTFRPSKSICQSKDSSVWTDTPTDQAKKQKEGQEKHGGKRSSTETDQIISERDQRCSIIVDEYNKNRRSESLLNMHTKQRKIAKRDSDEPVERQPFSREHDLEAVHLNSTQRKSIIEKSQSLGSRFGSGTSRFL